MTSPLLTCELHSDEISSMNPATTRPRMRWMHTRGPQNLTLPTLTSRPVSVSFGLAPPTVARHRLVPLPSRPMCTRKPTKLLVPSDRNGVGPRSSLLHQGRPRLPREQARTGRADCRTSTLLPSRRIRMRDAGSSSADRHRPCSGPLAPSKSTRCASRTPMARGAALRDVGRHLRHRHLTSTGRRVTGRPSLKRLLMSVSDVSPTPTGVAQPPRRMAQLPATETVSTLPRMAWLRTGRPTTVRAPTAGVPTTTGCRLPSRPILSTRRRHPCTSTTLTCRRKVLPRAALHHQWLRVPFRVRKSGLRRLARSACENGKTSRP